MATEVGLCRDLPRFPLLDQLSPAQGIPRQGRACRLRSSLKLELGAMAALVGDNEFSIIFD